MTHDEKIESLKNEIDSLVAEFVANEQEHVIPFLSELKLTITTELRRRHPEPIPRIEVK